MATHSSVLAWRIPGMGEPGGLLSMGSNRVRHDWSDLAAAGAEEHCKHRGSSKIPTYKQKAETSEYGKETNFKEPKSYIIWIALFKANSVVQLLNHVLLFEDPWTVAHQASLSSTISWSLLKLMPYSYLILCHHPLLLLPSIFPSTHTDWK